MSSQKPICSHTQGYDVQGLAGDYSVKNGNVTQTVEVKRLGVGKYSFELDPWRKKDSVLVLSFCRFDKVGVVEHRDFNPEKKTMSSLSYWPGFFENKNGELRFWLADSSIERLDDQLIPYEILKQNGPTKPYAFIALNEKPSLNRKLVRTLFRMEAKPYSVIDLRNKRLISPFFTRQ